MNSLVLLRIATLVVMAASPSALAHFVKRQAVPGIIPVPPGIVGNPFVSNYSDILPTATSSMSAEMSSTDGMYMPTPMYTDMPAPMNTGMPTPMYTDMPAPMYTDMPAPMNTGMPTPTFADIPAPKFSDMQFSTETGVIAEIPTNSVNMALPAMSMTPNVPAATEAANDSDMYFNDAVVPTSDEIKTEEEYAKQQESASAAASSYLPASSVQNVGSVLANSTYSPMNAANAAELITKMAENAAMSQGQSMGQSEIASTESTLGNMTYGYPSAPSSAPSVSQKYGAPSMPSGNSKLATVESEIANTTYSAAAAGGMYVNEASSNNITLTEEIQKLRNAHNETMYNVSGVVADEQEYLDDLSNGEAMLNDYQKLSSMPSVSPTSQFNAADFHQVESAAANKAALEADTNLLESMSTSAKYSGTALPQSNDVTSVFGAVIATVTILAVISVMIMTLFTKTGRRARKWATTSSRASAVSQESMMNGGGNAYMGVASEDVIEMSDSQHIV